MKKKYIVVWLVFTLNMVMLLTSGCSESKSDERTDTYQMETQEVSSEQNEKPDGKPNDDSGFASKRQRIIESQTFEVDMDEWGTVTFVSIAPEQENKRPEFVMIKNDEIFYTLYQDNETHSDVFEQVSGVKFTDYNMDGKKDILILVEYSNGDNHWNQPLVFLQENSDNMFYLDYPDLESYKLEGETTDKIAFYRDTYLEEYLSKQFKTKSLADMDGAWGEYTESLDSQFYGMLGVTKQLELFAQNRKQWAKEAEYANEEYRFTVADINLDGRLELIVSNCGGTGVYTYSHFYNIDENEKLKELDTTFQEGDSQPDIMDEDITTYFYISEDGKGVNNLIVHDYIKAFPTEYMDRISALAIVDDVVTEIPLASWTETIEGLGWDSTEEEYSTHTEIEDFNGEVLTDEEYYDYAEKYFSSKGAAKNILHLNWENVSDMQGVNEQEAMEILKKIFQD